MMPRSALRMMLRDVRSRCPAAPAATVGDALVPPSAALAPLMANASCLDASGAGALAFEQADKSTENTAIKTVPRRSMENLRPWNDEPLRVLHPWRAKWLRRFSMGHGEQRSRFVARRGRAFGEGRYLEGALERSDRFSAFLF